MFFLSLSLSKITAVKVVIPNNFQGSIIVGGRRCRSSDLLTNYCGVAAGYENYKYSQTSSDFGIFIRLSFTFFFHPLQKYWHERAAFQSVSVWVAQTLVATINVIIFSIPFFFFSVATFSHRRSTRIKKLILRKFSNDFIN